MDSYHRKVKVDDVFNVEVIFVVVFVMIIFVNIFIATSILQFINLTF